MSATGESYLIKISWNITKNHILDIFEEHYEQRIHKWTEIDAREFPNQSGRGIFGRRRFLTKDNKFYLLISQVL